MLFYILLKISTIPFGDVLDRKLFGFVANRWVILHSNRNSFKTKTLKSVGGNCIFEVLTKDLWQKFGLDLYKIYSEIMF